MVSSRGARMGLDAGHHGPRASAFVAVWALMMTAMMLPSVTPFASLYTRTFTDKRGAPSRGLASGTCSCGASPPSRFGLAWLADRVVGAAPQRRPCWRS